MDRYGSVRATVASVVEVVAFDDGDNVAYFLRSILGLDEYLRLMAFFVLGSVVVRIDGNVVVVVGRLLRFD